MSLEEQKMCQRCEWQYYEEEIDGWLDSLLKRHSKQGKDLIRLQEHILQTKHISLDSIEHVRSILEIEE